MLSYCWAGDADPTLKQQGSLTCVFHLMLFRCWAGVEDDVPTVKQHWVCWECKHNVTGGEGDAVAKAACFESRRLRVRTPPWPSSFKETTCFFPAHSYRFNIVESLHDREVACSAPDRHRARISNPVSGGHVLSHSSHHPQEVVLAQFSL